MTPRGMTELTWRSTTSRVGGPAAPDMTWLCLAPSPNRKQECAMKLTSAQVERPQSIQGRGASRQPSSGAAVEQLVRRAHFLPRQSWAQHRGADGSCRGGSRGRSGCNPAGRGCEYRQLEQWQSDHAGAARARADRRDRHARRQALSRSFGWSGSRAAGVSSFRPRRCHDPGAGGGAGCSTETGSEAGKVFASASSSALSSRSRSSSS